MNTPTLNHQEISQQAYQIYVRNGCRHGQALADWLEAEAELRSLKSEPEKKNSGTANGATQPAPTANSRKPRAATKKPTKAAK